VSTEVGSVPYVALAPGSNGAGSVVGAAPSLRDDLLLGPSQLSENLGAVGTYSLRTRLLVFDLIAAIAAWIGIGFAVPPATSVPVTLAIGSIGVIATLISLLVVRLYQSRVCVKWSQEIARIALASLVGGFAYNSAESSFHHPNERSALICGLACAAAISLLRGHYRRWLSAQRSRGRFLRNVILVGGNDDATELWKMLNSEPELGYRVTGTVGQDSEPRPWDHLLSSTTIADLPRLAMATGASGVLIASNAMSSKELQRAISVGSAHGLHVQVWPGLPGVASVRLREVPVSGEPFYYIEPQRTYRWQHLTKRAIDIAGSSLILLLASPLLAAAALAIKLERTGPVLHRQLRVGLNGDEFTVYKLRTMTVGSEDIVDEVQALNQRTDGPLYKNANDPRVTAVGRLLRPLSIDELPQLWNVLEGTMSLVGPRPALPHEVLQFDEDLQRRHNMRPGITGLWQARARENPSFNAYRRFDLHYVDNWSLRLDLSILFVTVPTVLAQATRGLLKSRAARSALGADAEAGSEELSNFPNIGDDPSEALEDNLDTQGVDPADGKFRVRSFESKRLVGS
jgi:exopolysaccharide biosynthesis polyprenyl glycosylphosphotransferase